VSPEGGDFLRAYFATRSRHSIFDTFQKIASPLRRADVYISFSPKIFRAHQIADHLPDEQPVYFIGVPTFDGWRIPTHDEPPLRAFLFIDQAFVKQRLLGWTTEFQERFIEDLAAKCAESGFELLVKLHPAEDHGNWERAARAGRLRIIGNEELERLSARVVAVGGYYSKLLMPLAAMPQSVVFTFEVHPAPDVFPSKFLVSAGVAERVDSVTSLPALLGRLPELRRRQQASKQQFLNDWLYKLDGGAGGRLRHILLSLTEGRE
jgi:hypothetical protein